MNLRLLLAAVLIALLFLPIIGAEKADAAAGWLGNWTYRVSMTADSGDIDANLSDFPFLVHLSTSSGRNGDDVSFVFDELTSDANRTKIAITTSDGTTQCYVEVEEWDDSGEEAWLWVKAPNLSSATDTVFYLYYDSAESANTAYVGDINSAAGGNVWTNNFSVVLHQRDATTSTILDSTTNNNDGTKSAANQPTVTTSGRISDAQDYESANSELVDHNHTASMDFPQMSLEAWVSRDASNHRDPIIDRRQPAPTVEVFGFEVVAADVIQNWFRENDNTLHGAWTSNTTVGTGWHHIVYTYDQAYVRFYLDGVPVGATAETAPMATNSTRHFRTGVAFGVYADQIIDEIRMHSNPKSGAWFAAVYESESDDLLDFGSQETEVAALPGPPTNFVLTRIGPGTINVNWTAHADATSTIVRVDSASYPANATAAWPVYSSSGNSTTYSGLDLDCITYYFRAWSQNAGGLSTTYAQGSIGSSDLFTALLPFIEWGIQLTLVNLFAALAFWRRHFFLYIIAAGVALVVGIDFADSYMIPGIVVVVLGLFMLYQAGWILIGRGSGT